MKGSEDVDIDIGIVRTPKGITSHWHWDPNGLGLVDEGTGDMYTWDQLEPEVQRTFMLWMALKFGYSFRAVGVT